MSMTGSSSANGHRPVQKLVYRQGQRSPQEVRQSGRVALAAEVIVWLYREALKELAD